MNNESVVVDFGTAEDEDAASRRRGDGFSGVALSLSLSFMGTARYCDDDDDDDGVIVDRVRRRPSRDGARDRREGVRSSPIPETGRCFVTRRLGDGGV